jgi:hypothetical protein
MGKTCDEVFYFLYRLLKKLCIRLAGIRHIVAINRQLADLIAALNGDVVIIPSFRYRLSAFTQPANAGARGCYLNDSRSSCKNLNFEEVHDFTQSGRSKYRITSKFPSEDVKGIEWIYRNLTSSH